MLEVDNSKSKTESEKEPDKSALARKLAELKDIRNESAEHEKKFQEASEKRLELQEKLGMRFGLVTAELPEAERQELEEHYDKVTEQGKLHGDILERLNKEALEKQYEIREIQRRITVLKRRYESYVDGHAMLHQQRDSDRLNKNATEKRREAKTEAQHSTA